MTLFSFSASAMILMLTAPFATANEIEASMPKHCHELALQFAAGIIDGVNVARVNPPRAELESNRIVQALVNMNSRLNEADDDAGRRALVECVDRGVIAAVKPVLAGLPKTELAAIHTYLDFLARMGNYEEGTTTRATVEHMAARGPAYGLMTKFLVAYPIGLLLAPSLIGVPAHPSVAYYPLSALSAVLFLVLDRMVARRNKIHPEDASSALRACAAALMPTAGD